MPRNGSGLYELPAGNPVIPGTIIESDWANNTMSDVATALTDSLDRQGRGGMLAALRILDGTPAAPGLGFSNETGTGLHRVDTGTLAAIILGTERARLTPAAFTTPADVDIVSGGDLSVAGAGSIDGALDVVGEITENGDPVAKLGADPQTFGGVNNFLEVRQGAAASEQRVVDSPDDAVVAAGSLRFDHMVFLTQAEYDALPVKDPATFYATPGGAAGALVDYLGTFTAAANVIDAVGVLTGYQSYFLQLDECFVDAGAAVHLQYLTGATPYTANYAYAGTRNVLTIAPDTYGASGAGTRFDLGGAIGLWNGAPLVSHLWMNDSQNRRSMSWMSSFVDNGTLNFAATYGTGQNTATGQNFDGIRIKPSSGALAGTLRVWGYKDAP